MLTPRGLRSCSLLSSRFSIVRCFSSKTTTITPSTSVSIEKNQVNDIGERFIQGNEKKRDVLIIGGGHNGLVAGNYLARKGLSVTVLERRHLVGGAAVTEEIIDGYKCSRASYLAGLLRPQIIQDLELEKYGFKYLPRDPSSFTPTLTKDRYLILGASEEMNWKSIAQFSEQDADAFIEYENFLGKIREILEPLLDGPPPDVSQGSWRTRLDSLQMMNHLCKVGYKNREILIPFYELLTAPASHILNRWFESDILKCTLATDAIIGAMCSPSTPGSAYVLLHHVMGEAAGRKGVWAYIEGGMGKVTQTIAESGIDHGMEIMCDSKVNQILLEGSTSSATGLNTKKAIGVELTDGRKLYADNILSNTTPDRTFMELIPSQELPQEFRKHIEMVDYSSAVMKINVALNKLPNFSCYQTEIDSKTNQEIAGPQHRGTIHFETTMRELEKAYEDASVFRRPSDRPVIEMTIPTSLDNTLAPKGKHVCTLFVQYAPYDLDPNIGSWKDPHFKKKYVEETVFKIIDEKAPGFSQSVIAYDALSPYDLEQIFGLHRGNIFHGALGLHQLAYTRPAPNYAQHRSPISNLYMCGSGTHPGGGVMGAPGRNCANILLNDLGISKTF